MYHKSLGIARTVKIGAAMILATAAVALAQDNTITFDNKSGKPALVRLVGPIAVEVAVPQGGAKTVTAGPGRYHIRVRYGTGGRFRYTKGDEFDITQTANSRSRIFITLHKVLDGNYETEAISAEEFVEGRATRPAATQDPMVGRFFLPAKEANASKTCSTRCGIESSPDGKHQKLTTDLGAGYIFQFTGGMYPDITSPGAEITMLGKVEWCGYKFDSDKMLPLVFKAVQGKGLAYMSGRGTAVAPSGENYVFGSKMTEENCSPALKDKDDLTREAAAQALGYLGVDTAVPGLVSALRDPSLTVRRNAIEALGKIGSKQAIEPLSRPDHDETLSKVVKEALARIAETRAAPQVVQVTVRGPAVAAIEAWPPTLIAFTPAHAPLKNLADIAGPAEYAVWGGELTTTLTAFLKAAGANAPGCMVIGNAHFPQLFKKHDSLKLFLTSTRVQNVGEITETGGGVKVSFVDENGNPIDQKGK